MNTSSLRSLLETFTALTLEALRRLRPLVRLASVVILVASLIGCRHGEPTSSEQSAPVSVYIAQDTSSSNRPKLAAGTEAVASLCGALDHTSWLTVLGFSNETVELFSGPPPSSREKLLKIIIPQLAVRSKLDFTYLDKLMAVVARRVISANGQSVLFLSTDGYCEGTDAVRTAELRKSVTELANCKRFRALVFLGVSTPNKLRLRDEFAAFGSRLRFADAGRLDASLLGLVKAEESAQ